MLIMVAPIPRAALWGLSVLVTQVQTEQTKNNKLGQVDPSKGYIHIFDDESLDIVLSSRDTVSDFVHYLTKKEEFVRSGGLAAAEGEEHLLASYVMDMNAQDEHDFVLPPDITAITLGRGLWEEFQESDEYKAQQLADRDSYKWDSLIEYFTHLMLGGAFYYVSHPELRDQAQHITLMARESRFRRRIIVGALIEFVSNTPVDRRNARIVAPVTEGDPYYIFLLLPVPQGVTHDQDRYTQYRDERTILLSAYCYVLKLGYPDAQQIVGLAFESPGSTGSSEDLIYMDARTWTEEDQRAAREAQARFHILKYPIVSAQRVEEYPVL